MADDDKVVASPGCEPGPSGFESRRSPHIEKPSPHGEAHSCVAQLVEHSAVNRGVAGSSPAAGASAGPRGLDSPIGLKFVVSGWGFNSPRRYKGT